MEEEGRPVRSWKSMAGLFAMGLLLHALYSGWLIDAETIGQFSPAMGETFETASTIYRREAAQIATTLRGLFGG